jgi:hypothetical protein
MDYNSALPENQLKGNDRKSTATLVINQLTLSPFKPGAPSLPALPRNNLFFDNFDRIRLSTKAGWKWVP